MKNQNEIKIWISTELAKILECDVDAIDPDLEFSSLGIDSMIAFALTGELSEWIGVDLSATLLWEYPTISSLSLNISEQLCNDVPEKLPDSKPIHLAGDGGQEKLFGICGIELYQNLGNQLSKTMNTYGVYIAPEKTLGKFNKDISHSYEYQSIEDLATRYVEEIISVQPKSPYYLIGLSVGGILAFEIAQQLRRLGAAIPLLVLLDSVLPNAVKVRADRQVINLLKSGASKLGNLEFKKFNATPNFSLEEMSKLRGQYYWELAKRYEPVSYHGPVILVRATSSKLFGLGYIADEKLGWEEFIVDNLFIVKINGTHTGILERPHVAELAKVIQDAKI